MSNTPESSQESSSSSNPTESNKPSGAESEVAAALTSQPKADAGDVADRPKIQVGKSSLGPRPQTQHGGPGGQRPGGQRPGGQKPGGPKPPRGPKPRREDQQKKDDDETSGETKTPMFVSGPRANVPVPSKREKSNPELEAELIEALGDLSLDEIVHDGMASRATQAVESESRLRATVVRVDKENVFFSLGGKNEGYVAIRQFKEPPAVGAELEVVVKGVNAEDGLYDLIVPGTSIDVGDWSDLAQGAIVEARITGANTGGLECMINNIRGFIPASQIGLFRMENFAEFVNQKLLCVVTEVNPKRKNLVLSHRAVLEREKEEARKKLMAELQPGQIHDGVIRKVQDFGVFVDIGGVDGLIHISKLSWDRIKHPSEVVQEGQKVRVKVERIDEQTGKISLSYRDLLDRPWDSVEQNFPVGTTARGAISRIANFGAFVKLAPGIEGLIHISELAHGRVRRVEDVLKEGQDVEVKILSVDKEAQRIALSYKATLPPPEAEAEAADEPDEPPRALAVSAKKRPLRGGFDRPTGGEGIGLNW